MCWISKNVHLATPFLVKNFCDCDRIVDGVCRVALAVVHAKRLANLFNELGLKLILVEWPFSSHVINQMVKEK